MSSRNTFDATPYHTAVAVQNRTADGTNIVSAKHRTVSEDVSMLPEGSSTEALGTRFHVWSRYKHPAPR